MTTNTPIPFVRTPAGWVHIIADKYYTRLQFFDSKESALAYIEWDNAQYGPRNDDAYLHYQGEAAIYHHENSPRESV